MIIPLKNVIKFHVNYIFENIDFNSKWRGKYKPLGYEVCLGGLGHLQLIETWNSFNKAFRWKNRANQIISDFCSLTCCASPPQTTRRLSQLCRIGIMYRIKKISFERKGQYLWILQETSMAHWQYLIIINSAILLVSHSSFLLIFTLNYVCIWKFFQLLQRYT